MADSSITVGYHILVLAAGLTLLAGFLINVFIVAVNISGWKKGRPVSTADKVITSLGISRMVFQVACLLNFIWDICVYSPSSLFFVAVTFLEVTSVCSSIWLSTLLSIVFCLKISTLKNTFFLRLKILVLNRVLHLIMVSVMMSISYGLIITLMINNFVLSNNSTREMYNNVLIGLEISTHIFQITGPFLIYFISSILLIIYLYHHVCRMRSEGNRSHLAIYYKTMKFIGFSLFCSTVFIIIERTSSYCYYVFGLLGLYFFWQIFPTLHSIYLIYVTTKLRLQVSNMVQMLRRRCCHHEAQVETIYQS